MVVVSELWVKNVAAYPPRSLNDMLISGNDKKMAAKAVLICRPNSHPFQERTLSLEQAVKVGRSVAKARATPTNAIFDCKVLSRHHALLWYENGKFFLQDTKSSNGTFVNNNRLAAESENHEVSSGDIVQFGVDVIENNRKVTHGCIIATLKLYLPDGKEAKASPSIAESNPHVVPLDELYKLHQIIQEATQREQCIESKLVALQAVVNEAKKSADESWQAYVGEERLLSRVSTLESQLAKASKNWDEDKYREEIVKLQEDNAAFQEEAKKALKKLHDEKLEALGVATEQERSRISAEQEVILAKVQVSLAQEELEEVAQKLMEEKKKAEEERIRLEQQHWDLQTQLEAETEKVETLKMKLSSALATKEESLFENHILFDDDAEKKMDLIYEPNEDERKIWSCQSTEKLNGVNEATSEQNHISLRVAPVTEEEGDEKEKKEDRDKDTEKPVTNEETSGSQKLNNHSLTHQDTIVAEESRDGEKHVTFSLPEEDPSPPESPSRNSSSGDETEKDDFECEGVDSKTLKNRYQTAQNALKLKVETLRAINLDNDQKIGELSAELGRANDKCSDLEGDNDDLRNELAMLRQKLLDSLDEGKQIEMEMVELVEEVQKQDQADSNHHHYHKPSISDDPPSTNKKTNLNSSSTSPITYEQFVALEEELVVLKTQYCRVMEEKQLVQGELKALRQKYNQMCNTSYNKLYFYVAPLILMILYLVISAMIS